jgi:hypothetical protein
MVIIISSRPTQEPDRTHQTLARKVNRWVAVKLRLLHRKLNDDLAAHHQGNTLTYQK